MTIFKNIINGLKNFIYGKEPVLCPVKVRESVQEGYNSTEDVDDNEIPFWNK